MLPSEADHITPRRIRHITSVQIRNLTPFPLRDSFTSSLSQPVDLTSTTDDLGSIRKRPRKSSTRRSLNGIFENDTAESRGRSSSASTSGPVSTSPTNVISSPPRSIHTGRPIRPRTSSMTSFSSTHPSTSAASAPLPTVSFLPNNSQVALQKVIASRLVETFIAISIPTSTVPYDSEPPSSKPLRSAPLPKPSVVPSGSRTSKQGAGPQSMQTEGSPFKNSHKSLTSPPDSAPPHKTFFKTSTTSKNGPKAKSVVSPRLNGALTSSNDPKGKSPEKPIKDESQSPVYFSPIHRPSTNPYFPLDTRSGRDFPQWYNISGQRLKVEVWGKMTHDLGRKEHHPLAEGENQGWSLLDEWDFDLDKLAPLPDDVDTNSSSLPSNVLVLTLSPPGEVLYLPPKTAAFSRPSTPSAGYTSDPESEIRKAKQVDQPIGNSDILPLSRRRRRKRINSTADSRDTIKTAGWQELFKLVTLHSCVLDNEASVGEVVRKIDGLLEDDGTISLRRQISERETRIKELRRDHDVVLEECSRKRAEIVTQRENLQRRTELLKSAHKNFDLTYDLSQTIAEERTRLKTLHENMQSIRTSLLSTLSTIFPIELLSPPDLLFTILEVPLPIPLNTSDPAPPLTLADHKEVTEEAVATALGYVAQVLQILAAYIGKNLIYPVTCIGSRSLIRDGISAMVGPRMFPLFSKGVDTYRFEYGVFLLNKDIEMLMSERDLRALDIRHTLPNLKNLMLTLSHDNAPTTRPIKRSHSPISMASGLETPSREPSPTNDDASTPKASHIMTDSNGVDRNRTPSASRPTTPTTMSDDARKPKSFLGFVPFTDFLRGRYPSAGQGSISDNRVGEDEFEDGSDDAASNADLDEDDRRTIHGVASDIPGGPSHLVVESTVEAGERVDASV